MVYKYVFYLTFSADIKLLLTERDKDISHPIKPCFCGLTQIFDEIYLYFLSFLKTEMA